MFKKIKGSEARIDLTTIKTYTKLNNTFYISAEIFDPFEGKYRRIDLRYDNFPKRLILPKNWTPKMGIEGYLREKFPTEEYWKTRSFN